jgi:O-antigen ligase
VRYPPVITVDATFARERAAGRPTVLDVALVLPMFVAGVIDLPHETQIGGVTLMGALAALQTCAVLFAVFTSRRYPRRLLLALTPWAGFLAWGVLRTATADVTIAAAQNAVVYLLFGLTILHGGVIASRSPGRARSVIEYGIAWIDIAGLALAYGNVLAFGPARDGTVWLIGPRSVALLGLVALSWHLAWWVETGRQAAAFRAAAWLVAIVLSLSRTATAVAVLQTAIVVSMHAWFVPRRLVSRAIVVVPMATVIAAFVAFNFVGLGERFTTPDYNVVEVGGVSISTSGRSNVWPVIVASAAERPIIGWGLASSEHVTNSLWEAVGHPHNDYLRVWHDLGITGLVLFLAATVSWSRRLFADACEGFRSGGAPAVRVLPLAGFLALVGLLVMASTDNAIIYAFIMGPVGVLVGAGLMARREW